MTDSTRAIALAATILLAGGRTAPASAAFITYDLTGTWTGSLKCNTFVTGLKQKTVQTPVMKISQLGLNFGVQLDFGGEQSFYGGLANPDAKKPEQKGEAALIRCETNDVLNDGSGAEIGRMAASTKPGKVKASFKGQSFFSDPSLPNPAHGTCKWKWTRTDAADPGVLTACAVSVLRLPPARQGGGAR